MSVREEIILILENNRGLFVSGSDIGRQLGISRNAVSKTIKGIIEEGYKIKAVTNKGYCLLPSTDILSNAGIEKYLNIKDHFDFQIYNDEISSTNKILKEQAINGASEGQVIVACSQTDGRGRFGRKFYSPSNTGLYFSVLLRPDLPAKDATLITTASAVAICKAIELIANKDAKIKWVNDIFIEEKKVAGILTEAIFDTETGIIDCVILGVGINIYKPKNDFPQDIKETAGFVFDTLYDDIRNKLLAYFLNNFWIYYKNLQSRDFVAEYKKRSCILGREILVYKKDITVPATAMDIDNDCRLLVKYNDGNYEYLSTGEVSIKAV